MNLADQLHLANGLPAPVARTDWLLLLGLVPPHDVPVKRRRYVSEEDGNEISQAASIEARREAQRLRRESIYDYLAANGPRAAIALASEMTLVHSTVVEDLRWLKEAGRVTSRTVKGRMDWRAK